MKPFAELLERLLYSPQRNAKLALLEDYFRRVPDPDRGWGLAALTGALELRHAKPGARARARDHAHRPGAVRLVLRLRRRPRRDRGPGLAGAGGRRPGRLAASWRRWWRILHAARRAELPELVAGWLDALDATGRWALLKLVTGGAAGRRLGPARQAGAGRAWARSRPAEIEEVWHGLEPPYVDLFAWLEGRAPRPDAGERRPGLPAADAGAPDRGRRTSPKLDPEPTTPPNGSGTASASRSRAGEGGVRLYSRTGDDISARLPRHRRGARLRGRARRRAAGRARRRASAPFNDLQQRLNRKTRRRRRCCATIPAFVRLYDILLEGEEDLRAAALRRAPRAAGGVRRPRAAGADRPVAAGRRSRAWPSSSALRQGARGDARSRA